MSRLLVVLEPEGGERQELSLQCKPLHPEDYLRIWSEAETEPAGWKTSVHVEPRIGQLLPARPVQVTWLPTTDDQSLFVRRPPAEATFDFQTQPDAPPLTAEMHRRAAELSIVLTIDGYPRAVRLLQPKIGRGRPVAPGNGQLRLAAADAKGQPQRDDDGNIVWLEENAARSTPIDQLYAMYQVDLAESGEDREVVMFVVSGDNDKPPLPNQIQTFRVDRMFTATLRPSPGDEGGFDIQAFIGDLAGALHVGSISEGRIRVQGAVRTIGTGATSAMVERAIYIDPRPPTTVVPDLVQVTVGRKQDVLIVAKDEEGQDPSGVAKVLYSEKLNDKGQLEGEKAAEKSEFQERWIIPVLAEKAGPGSVYVLAEDRAANRGKPMQIRLDAKEAMVGPDPKDTRPGKLRIRLMGNAVAYYFDAFYVGPKSGSAKMNEDGTILIPDLPPGDYKVHAVGRLRGNSALHDTDEKDVKILPGATQDLDLRPKPESKEEK